MGERGMGLACGQDAEMVGSDQDPDQIVKSIILIFRWQTSADGWRRFHQTCPSLPRWPPMSPTLSPLREQVSNYIITTTTITITMYITIITTILLSPGRRRRRSDRDQHGLWPHGAECQGDNRYQSARHVRRQPMSITYSFVAILNFTITDLISRLMGIYVSKWW